MAFITVEQGENASRDANDLAAIVNESTTVTTRYGGDKLSVDQALSQIIVGEVSVYSAAATYTNIEDWVEYSGVVYRPLPSALPIGPEAFNAANWAVAQGAGAAANITYNSTTVGGYLDRIDATTDYFFDSVSSMVANSAGVEYREGMILQTSSHYVASAYTGQAYGGAKYKVTTLDSDKVTGRVQIDLDGTLAAELVGFNDAYISQLGCLDSSTHDSSVFIQAYVDYFATLSDGFRLKLELTSYFFATTLSLLNLGNDGSYTIEGVSKCRKNSRGMGSIIYGNTGNNNPVILIAGTENVNLRKFSIFSASGGSLTSPSTIGLHLARTATKTYCQFVNIEEVHISLASIPTVNNNYGSIGIYNYASETHNWSDVSISADSPMIMTTTDIVGITYDDYFDNTGTESIYTTTNFNYNHLQLYPLTYSPLILDIVRDMQVNTLLAFSASDILKYVIEFYGILPNRRIFINNLHAEKIRRTFRIGNPLYESTFSGKVGTGISDQMISLFDDGVMENVEFNCFCSSSGIVSIISDSTSNASFDVRIRHIRETNGANISSNYQLGTAVYSNLEIATDSQTASTAGTITGLSSNIIRILGTDGIYEWGTWFQGTTAQRPTTGLYDGKQYYDQDLNIPIWWNGSNWRDSAGVVA